MSILTRKSFLLTTTGREDEKTNVVLTRIEEAEQKRISRREDESWETLKDTVKTPYGDLKLQINATSLTPHTRYLLKDAFEQICEIAKHRQLPSQIPLKI